MEAPGRDEAAGGGGGGKDFKNNNCRKKTNKKKGWKREKRERGTSEAPKVLQLIKMLCIYL